MGSCYVHKTQGAQPNALWQTRGGNGVRCGRQVKDRGDMCTLMTDLLFYGRTNTTL